MAWTDEFNSQLEEMRTKMVKLATTLAANEANRNKVIQDFMKNNEVNVRVFNQNLGAVQIALTKASQKFDAREKVILGLFDQVQKLAKTVKQQSTEIRKLRKFKEETCKTFHSLSEFEYEGLSNEIQDEPEQEQKEETEIETQAPPETIKSAGRDTGIPVPEQFQPYDSRKDEVKEGDQVIEVVRKTGPEPVSIGYKEPSEAVKESEETSAEECSSEPGTETKETSDKEQTASNGAAGDSEEEPSPKAKEFLTEFSDSIDKALEAAEGQTLPAIGQEAENAAIEAKHGKPKPQQKILTEKEKEERREATKKRRAKKKKRRAARNSKRANR